MYLQGKSLTFDKTNSIIYEDIREQWTGKKYHYPKSPKMVNLMLHAFLNDTLMFLQGLEGNCTPLR